MKSMLRTSSALPLAALAMVGLICTILFWKMLPPAQHFQSRSMAPAVLWQDIIRIYKDPGLPWLFTTAFLIMGAFVSIYNYLGFRLSAAPYDLGPAAIGAIFLLYAVGSASSALAGHLVDHYGRSVIMRGMIAAMAIGRGLAQVIQASLINRIGNAVVGDVAGNARLVADAARQAHAHKAHQAHAKSQRHAQQRQHKNCQKSKQGSGHSTPHSRLRQRRA